MSSISQCQNDIRRYKNLKININTIISNLDLASSDTTKISREIKNKYLVNDAETPITGRVDKLKIDIDSTVSYLNNTVLPAIDKAIKDLEKEMDHLEAEELAERTTSTVTTTRTTTTYSRPVSTNLRRSSR